MTAKIEPKSFYIVDQLTKNGTVQGTPNSRYITWTDQVLGEDTPNWKEKLKAGLPATSPCSGQKCEQPYSVGSIFFDKKNPGTGGTDRLEAFGSIYHQLPSILPITDSETQARALARYVSNARSAVKSANGLQILGEMRETLSLLRHPLTTSRKLVQTYIDNAKRVKSSVKTHRERMRIISNMWLEFRFGWQPLAADVKSIISAVQKLEEPIRQHIRGGDTFENTFTLVSGFSTNLWGIPVLATVVEKSTINYLYRGSMVGSCSGPVDANTRFGVSVDEFLPTAWELLPYSFLIDYFANIGDLVSAASFFDSRIAWTNYTARQEQTRSVTILPNVSAAKAQAGVNYINVGGLITFESKKVQFGRSMPTTLMPTFQAHLPGRPVQYVNMAALLLQSRGLLPF